MEVNLGVWGSDVLTEAAAFSTAHLKCTSLESGAAAAPAGFAPYLASSCALGTTTLITFTGGSGSPLPPLNQVPGSWILGETLDP